MREGPQNTQCESAETTTRKGRLSLAGAVQRTINERLTRRAMFGAMAGGENPKPGRTEQNWAQCLADDLKAFQATEGSTESSPLKFGVETVLWARVAKKSVKWYPGVVEAAGCFMRRWEMDEKQRFRLRHAAEDAKNGDEGRGEGGSGSRTDTAVDGCRNEMINRVANYRVEQFLQCFAGIFLTFVVLRPCSRYLSFLSTKAFRLAAFLNPLRHL